MPGDVPGDGLVADEGDDVGDEGQHEEPQDMQKHSVLDADGHE